MSEGDNDSQTEFVGFVGQYFEVMLTLVITAILASSAYGQQPSTVPAAQANTASVLRASGSSAPLRLRQPAHHHLSQPAYHYDSLLSEEESNNRVRVLAQVPP